MIIYSLAPKVPLVLIIEFTNDEEVITYIIDVYNKTCM